MTRFSRGSLQLLGKREEKPKAKKQKGGGERLPTKPPGPSADPGLGFSSHAGVPPLRQQAPASYTCTLFLFSTIPVSLFPAPPIPGGPQPAPRVPTGPTLPSVFTCFWTGSPWSSSTSLVTSGRMLQSSLLWTWWAFYRPPGVVLGTEGQMSWPCSEPAGQL